MSVIQNYLSLFQELSSDTTVITPNRRLSATLHKLYQQYQIDQQNSCWQTPDILPVSTWIQRLWNNYTSKAFVDVPILLNSAQELFLWESIITEKNESTPLLQVSETAEIAKSAWGILKQWLVDIDHPIFNSTNDYIALYAWANHFQKICEERGWIDTASLTDIVTAKIKSNNVTSLKKIILFGFTELSPQLKQLISACQTNHYDTAIQLHSCHRISLIDTDDEILTIARWAKATLQSARDPSSQKTLVGMTVADVRIGCVIPSLDKMRDRVMQIFSEVIEDKCFNISAGKPLLQCPIIYIAFQLLALHKKSVPLDTFSSLLMSPFLGSAEFERIKRANLDHQLRRDNITTIHIPHDLIKKHCPQLEKKLQAFLTVLHRIPKEQNYSQWANVFTELLATLGWPGERSLSSEEYQIIEHWLHLLEEFATLDQIAMPVKMYQALHTLQKMAAKSIFQPKTPDAPIQILGLLEAAGMPLDYLWVAGMDDMSWPPQPKPNPLIPKRLQRELNMPHATAERELTYCQQLTQQFKENAQYIIFSHAEKNDELELQPSPLIRDIPEISTKQLNLDVYQSPAEKIFQTKSIETILDETAPAHAGGEKVLGGVNVLKQQALCPFKAFAEMRLHARELESPLPGLRAKDRGSILHKVMEILWNNMHDHATLCEMDEQQLSQRIHSSINDALAFFPNSHNDKQQYLSLEKKRLFKLVWDWMQIEKQRSPFKVLVSEKSTQITLNQLSLTVRIDRVDELEDGKKLVIDYKTGKNNDINRWFGDRPEEPQLPLYSLLDPDNTVGITFAQIFPGNHCFKGISRYALDTKGIETTSESKKVNALSWNDQLLNWNDILTKLSNDFYLGIANVAPKNPPETCEWCALKPLCRINETTHDH